MVGIVGRRGIQLVYLDLLVFFLNFFDLKLRSRVYLLLVEIGWHTKLILLEVLFVLLSIKWIVDYLDLDLQLCVHFPEIAQRQSPVDSLNLDSIALLVKLVC